MNKEARGTKALASFLVQIQTSIHRSEIRFPKLYKEIPQREVMINMKKQNGFSLIELLIVVVIIGIIAAIAIPNYLAARRSANEASTVSALRTLHGANAGYPATVGNGKFAVDLAALNSANLIDSTLSGAVAAANAKNGYFYTYDGTGVNNTPS